MRHEPFPAELCDRCINDLQVQIATAKHRREPPAVLHRLQKRLASWELEATRREKWDAQIMVRWEAESPTA